MTINHKNSPPSGQVGFSEPTVLPHWGLITVEGVDAAAFLQNQLTNSVLGLNPTLAGQIAKSQNSVRLVGYCNPKGRLLASAWVALLKRPNTDIDCFGLFISRDLAASIAKRLSMYVLRSKVVVRDVSEEWKVSCLAASDETLSHFSPAAGQFALRLPNVLLERNVCARILLAEPLTSNNHIDEDHVHHWNYLEVISAIPRIVLATQEQFVPQMINFESVAGIDFKKGCYPGQEIVARSQYRGAIKRRLQLAHLDANGFTFDKAAPGIELFHSGDADQPAGMVVLSAVNPFNPHRVDLQIECKLEVLEAGKLHLGSVAGPSLLIDSLPYPLIEI